MHVQKSFSKNMGAVLYLVTTPIGNLSDMTPRGIEILKSVALIASEDTRVTKKLCNHFEIKTPLTSYFEHNKNQKTNYILERLANGDDVALVSDAGMPLISDPGDQLVEKVLEKGHSVVPIPGANAALTALIASGLVVQPFLFYGFLNRQKSKKRQELLSLSQSKFTMVFYESPYRLKETLSLILEELGDRRVVIARELTKLYEEFVRGTVAECLDYLDEIKGEVVLILEGCSLDGQSDDWWKDLSLDEHVDSYVKNGMKTNEGIKKVANDRGVSKQEVYKAYHR